jgi:ubiquinone/menaquinone biosynthesis C-methylase UbiE
VLSSLFFHHLDRDNKLSTLREIRRVLKPGAEVHIADWGKAAKYTHAHTILWRSAVRQYVRSVAIACTRRWMPID